MPESGMPLASHAWMVHAPTPGSQGHSSRSLRSGPVCHLNVRYPKRMRPFQVYPVEVHLEWAPSMQSTPAVTQGSMQVQLDLPGGLVSPPLQVLEVGAVDQPVTFQVTPLATGTLPDVTMTYDVPGQGIQTLTLPMRVTTQRWTWLLLLGALFLPMVLLKARGWTGLATPAAGVTQRMELLLPEAMPMRASWIGLVQQATDFIVLRGVELGLPLFTAGILGLSAIFCWFAHRPRRGQMNSTAFQITMVPSERTAVPAPSNRPAPPYLTPVAPSELDLDG